MRPLRSALVAVLACAGLAAAPPPADDLAAYLNARLSRSVVKSVEPGGQVRIQTPDETSYTFDLRDVAVNLNARNGDARVRIFAEPTPGRVGRLRESFTCRSAEAAREVIAALRRRRAELLAGESAGQGLRQALKSGDPELGFATVGEALDFVSDRLLISVAMRLDPDGQLVLGSAETTFRVDLRRVEACLDDRGSDPQVRLYGDWALERLEEGRSREAVARVAFTTDSRREAFQVIKALYVLKGAFTGQAPDLARHRAVNPGQPHDTRTVKGLVEALNDKLTISKVLDCSSTGVLTINASEHIFRVELRGCTFARVQPDEGLKGLVKRAVTGGPSEGILVRNPRGIRQYSGPTEVEVLDEQMFACDSAFESRDALDLLEQLQRLVK